MGCNECKFNKTCNDAFTTISQYCGNYSGDYEIVKLLYKDLEVGRNLII